MPNLKSLDMLAELLLSRNLFTGTGHDIEGLFSLMRLKVLDLSHNSFSGELNLQLSLESEELRRVDLSHNQLSGDISRFVEPFCKLNPVGGSLQELRLNHNEFNGAGLKKCWNPRPGSCFHVSTGSTGSRLRVKGVGGSRVGAAIPDSTVKVRTVKESLGVLPVGRTGELCEGAMRSCCGVVPCCTWRTQL